MVDLIELTLNHGLFVVRAAGDLAEAETILATWRPHMAIVDMDHVEAPEVLAGLCRQYAAPKRDSCPGLHAAGRLTYEASGIRPRGGRCLRGPVLTDELLARSIVISRRATGIDRPIVPTIKLGEMEVDIVHRLIRAGDSVIHLSGIEQSLLYVLASRSGRVVTREEILDSVWGTDFVAESNIVDRHIRSLRIKLQDDYRRPRFIETGPGKGYGFVPTFTNQGWTGGSRPN